MSEKINAAFFFIYKAQHLHIICFWQRRWLLKSKSWDLQIELDFSFRDRIDLFFIDILKWNHIYSEITITHYALQTILFEKKSFKKEILWNYTTIRYFLVCY